MDLSAIKTQRTFEAVSQRILSDIRSGVLKIGDRLPNERDLARSLSVSRHAVREALRVLESVGMLELRKGATGGAFVAQGRPKAMSDVMRGLYYGGGITLEQLTEARLWIESIVVREACTRATEPDFAAMEANVAVAERETIAANLPVKTGLNIEFHNLLAAATHNPVMVLVMGAVMDILREFVDEVGSVMGMDVIRSRRRLLRHLRARRQKEAVAEMERHLRVLHRHYLKAASDLEAKKQSKL